ERLDAAALGDPRGQPSRPRLFPRPRAEPLEEEPLGIALPQIPRRDLPDQVRTQPGEGEAEERLEGHRVAEVLDPDEGPRLGADERAQARPEGEVQVPLPRPAEAEER